MQIIRLTLLLATLAISVLGNDVSNKIYTVITEQIDHVDEEYQQQVQRQIALRRRSLLLAQTGAVEESESDEEYQSATPSPPPLAATGPSHIIEEKLSLPVETFFAFCFCAMISSVPFVLSALSTRKLTRIHVVESVSLIVWLGGAIYLFTNVLKFQSVHFKGIRTLTVVEAVYLLAQVITTVGYGDIVPAYDRGRVFLGFYVLAALLLYGGIMMEVSSIISERVKLQSAWVRERVTGVKASEANKEELHQYYRAQPLKDWYKVCEVTYTPLLQSLAGFSTIVAIGVIFWHNWPGENKTLFQALYMSVITLSTVGFGAFTALTNGGKVFAAFWMLVGVGALGSVIGCSIELMLKIKDNERFNAMADAKLQFYELASEYCKESPEKVQYMDRYQFLLFALRLNNRVTKDDIEKIQYRYQYLDTQKSDRVQRDMIQEVERPPFEDPHHH